MSTLTKLDRLLGDPFHALDTIQTRLTQLISEIDGTFPKQLTKDEDLVPRVDISRDNESLYYMMEIPGVQPADLKITASDGVLMVHGEKKRVESKKEHNFKQYERVFGEFTRTFSLPDGVDVDKIHAELDNGVLELRIPMPAVSKEKVKEIKISTGGQDLPARKSNGHQAVVA